MAEKLKDRLSVGQKVRFLRSHDRSIQLIGKIVKVHEGADDCVDIKTIPDGKIAEVSTIETAHASDVTPILENKKKSQSAAEDNGDDAA